MGTMLARDRAKGFLSVLSQLQGDEPDPVDVIDEIGFIYLPEAAADTKAEVANG